MRRRPLALRIVDLVGFSLCVLLSAGWAVRAATSASMLERVALGVTALALGIMTARIAPFLLREWRAPE